MFVQLDREEQNLGEVHGGWRENYKNKGCPGIKGHVYHIREFRFCTLGTPVSLYIFQSDQLSYIDLEIVSKTQYLISKIEIILVHSIQTHFMMLKYDEASEPSWCNVWYMPAYNRY